MRTLYVVGLVLQLVIAPNVAAQTRSDTEFVAAVAVLKECAVTPSGDIKDEGKPARGENFAAIGSTFLAGLTGDLVAAGLNALGGALEQASREKGFSAIGNTSFNYFVIQHQEVYGQKEVTLRPDLLPDQSKCLVISYAAKPSFGPADDSVVAELKAHGLESPFSVAWVNAGLPQNPDVYVEAVLQNRLDGFIVRPSLVWYRNPFPKAPNREVPAELHASFSTPSGPTGEASALFALARLRLPPLMSGTLVRAEALKAYSSGVLPARSTDGSPEKTRAAFSQAFSSYETNKQEILKAQRALDRAKAAAAETGAKDETKAKVQPLEDQLADLTATNVNLKKRWDAIQLGGFPSKTGSTNVSARFTVVRSANQFGLALANALKGRAKAAGEAITTELTPTEPPPTWTASDTGYVTAMSAVATAQRALDIATAGTDAEAIFAAQISVRNAKAAANAAAAASNRPLPFPDLI